MGERGLHETLDLPVAGRKLLAPEGDERRVDIRRRPEDRSRHRVEAGALGGELNEHRDGAVGLRARGGEEAVGDLPLHHHTPQADTWKPVEALDDDRSRHVVRQVRDELAWSGIELGWVERECVAEVEVHALVVWQVRLERAVDLDRVHEPDPLGQEAREDAEAGADLEHDVGRFEVREPLDHAQDVLVDQEVLAELLLRRDDHGRQKQAAAFASILAAKSPGSSPRAAASAITVCTTWAGSFCRPRTGRGAR